MANAELPQSSIHPNTPDPSRRPSPQHRPTSPAQLPLNPPSLNFTFPPSRQASPLAQKTGTQTQRRLRSFADVKHPPSDTTLAYVRGVPNVRSDVADNKGKGPAQVEDLGEPDVFSDEYDLSRADPKIMKDVQRALKLKARRDARIQSGQLPRKEATSKSDVASRSSVSTTPSPHRLLFPTSPPDTVPQAEVDAKAETEIDFGPSTGFAIATTSLHPVPTSLDNGAVLDWTGTSGNEEKYERRWTLSISRRKEKDRPQDLGPMGIEKQEILHAKKIIQIKARASTHTLRKAEITSDQLRRRYDVLHGSLMLGSSCLNLSAVARWYRDQDTAFKVSTEEEEPFTWLKHLDKGRAKPSNRLHWHLSALIVEEYAHFHNLSNRTGSVTSADLSPSSPSPYSRSRPSPHHISSWSSLDPVTSRTRLLEGQVSFEPLVDSTHSSLDSVHRRSVDGPARHQRHSLPNRVESRRDSIHSRLSESSQQNPRNSSPASSLLHVRDFAQRIHRRISHGDDDALSSARNSVSERSENEARQEQDTKSRSHPVDLDLQSDREVSSVDPEIKVVISSDPSETMDVRLPVSTGQGSGNVQPRTVSNGKPVNSSSHTGPPDIGHRVFGRRRVKTSLPSSGKLALRKKQLLRLEIDEEQLNLEYELKAQLLDDTIAHDNRVRHLLSRVVAGVREYDMIKSNLSKALGLTYKHLPPDLLDAFNHDAAVVSAATRRRQNWRAVEETHRHLARQRDTFRNFLTATANPSIFSPPGSVLRDPIRALLQSLESLEVRQQEIANKAKEVADALAQVKIVHAEVKNEYNKTLSHTSVVYPELSIIVALEESYKDQYQQIWEFGLDALTLLLDTVTPFWRHYGKAIGDDVQDFLVIPLYRNEFTGEPKRYLIQRFPRRSIRHWMVLLLFFVLAVAVTWLQARTAVTSIINLRLRWITHGGVRWLVMPFFWIGIIIQCAAVFTELCLVVAQVGVVVWWIGWSIKVFT